MIIDDLQYSLWIDGEPWPDYGSSIKQLTIFHKHSYAVPLLEIVLEDSIRYIGTQFFLADGIPLRLVWGKGEIKLTYNFRLAYVKRFVSNNVFYYIVHAYWDNTAWFLDGTTKSYNDTSANAIAAIASECGLDSEVDATSDTQKWLGNSKRRYVFARHIAKKGFINDNSLMRLAVMPENSIKPDRVIYKDLNSIEVSSPVAALVYGQGSLLEVIIQGKKVPLYPVTSYDIIHKGGINSLLEGYRVTQVDQGIQNKDSFKDNKTVNVRPRASLINRSSEIGDPVNPVIRTASVTTDNTHADYNKADYQNSRGFSLLSNVGISLITNKMTFLSIFDPIVVRVSGTEIGSRNLLNESNEEYDGAYIVMSKIIHIEGSLYSERIISLREGSNI